LQEDELEEIFSKYGRVEKVQIMLDPHTRESRGFGFVQMSTAEEADAAREGLTERKNMAEYDYRESTPCPSKFVSLLYIINRQGQPTPGKYFGPPKRICTSIEPTNSLGDSAPLRRGGGPPRGDYYDRGYGRDRGYDRHDDRYDGRRRDYDSHDRYDRPRYDDRYQPSGGGRGNYSRRDDYYYDSRR
jgi:hypothetical protein